MDPSNQIFKKGMAVVITMVILSANNLLDGQEIQFNYFYRVYFNDKGDYSPGNFLPEDILSTRAIERRHKAGINNLDIHDLPVFRQYLDQIISSGLTLHCTSKWMNTALFQSQAPADLNFVKALPFVDHVITVKSPSSKSQKNDKLTFIAGDEPFPSYDRPVTMLNGTLLHESGYNGGNILIAVLDGGFANTDIISSLDGLRSSGRIKYTYDFVKNNHNVLNSSQHGTAVLSVLAGDLPGMLGGTAPGAEYVLLKTEDVDSEFPCEEDYWAAGAELADSLGADIISSSLGYFTFDDPALDYKTSDLNGRTAFITKAAGVAASRNILVVNSAGNERDKIWKYIIFPADGDSVLSAGAVDGNNIISSFSSSGPTSDGRVKPDNVAMGVNVPVQISLNTVTRLNGTSFSCPILSGMSACLMQAVPEATANDIIQALRKSADRFNSPDSLYGYGIPDMLLTLSQLQNIYAKTPEDGFIIAPNPSTGDIKLIFRETPGLFTAEVITISGKTIFRKTYPEYAGRVIHISEFQYFDQGIYLIRISTPQNVWVKRAIKLRN